MPAVITKYALIVDQYRLNVKPSNILPLEGSPVVDLVTLTHAHAKPVYTAHGFTLERVNSTDPAFHLRYNVYVGNALLGFILTDKTKKYGINKHQRPFHMHNEAFYTMPWAEFLSQFLRVYGLAVGNHSQLDISLNTQHLNPAALLDYYLSKPAKYQQITTRNDKGFSEYGRKGKPEYTTYWGEESSRVRLKMYSKTHELASKPKQYISDWFAAVGFDPDKPVYRLEISIRAEALREYHQYAVTEDGEQISMYKARNNNVLTKASKHTEITAYHIDIQKLCSPAYLAALAAHFFPIDIRLKDATRPTNCTRVSLIDWSIYPSEALSITVATRPTTNTLATQKTMLKNLVNLYAETGNTTVLDTARFIAARDNLTETLGKLLAKLPSSAPVTAPSSTPNSTPALAA
jgi:hypothetical protein